MTSYVVCRNCPVLVEVPDSLCEECKSVLGTEYYNDLDFSNLTDREMIGLQRIARKRCAIDPSDGEAWSVRYAIIKEMMTRKGM